MRCRRRGIERLVGASKSDACVFSFYANKTITTGEGGMIATRDPIVAARARMMRTHGLNRDAFDRFNRVGASWSYDIVAAGFKYNLTDLAAAIGLAQLERVYEFQARRAGDCRALSPASRGFAHRPAGACARAADSTLGTCSRFESVRKRA